MAKGELSTVRVEGEENVADGLTKHVDRQKVNEYVKACGTARRNGKHELSPQLGDSEWAFFF